MRTRILITFLAVTLAACVPAQTSTADIQNTAIAAAWTDAFLTQTAMPTATLPPTVTPTATDVVFFGTPPPPTISPTATSVVFMGTLPPTPVPAPILTPDAIQVERWQEYQAELAKALFSYAYQNYATKLDPEGALCEWDILGQSGQEVYVFAACVMAKSRGGWRIPAIIYLEPDGSVREVKLPETHPEYQGEYRYYDFDLFPIEVQEKFCYYYELSPYPCPPGIWYPSRIDVLYAHLEYRKTHPGEPPLVVLLAAPTATSTP